MARSDRSEQEFNRAVTLGRQNKVLLPRLRNWCRHLQIEDQSGGLIAEMYGLPMNLELSCPHAEGSFMAANLEWNAQTFITDNCVNCAFHAEIFPHNFGREVLAQREQAAQAAALQAQEKAARRIELQAEINALLTCEQTQADTKALSILTLMQQLDSEQADQASAASTVLEAARLSPGFFTAAALNYLALHLDGSQASMLLQTLRVLVESGKELPNFALQRLMAVVEHGHPLDVAVGLLVVAIAPAELLAQPNLVRRILERLDYERRAMRMQADEEEGTAYPNVVALVQRLAAVNSAACQQLLRQQLELPNKQDRIRVLGLLQDVVAVTPELVLPITEWVVRSLEFSEDGYGESADHATRHLLASLYAYSPDTVFKMVQDVYSTLSEAAQVELLEFYGDALQDKELLVPTHAAILTSQLVGMLPATTSSEAVRQCLAEQLEDIAYREPQHLIPHFEALLGFLVIMVNSYRTFQWYEAELQQPTTPPTTFNPLLGLPVFEVHHLNLQHQQRVTRAERTLEHVLKAGQADLHQAVLQVFGTLRSDQDAWLKSRLLKVLRDGLTDPVRIGHTLPVVYTSLFDPTARDVRWEALRSVEHLLDRYPQCATLTLLEVVKALLKDPDIPIRGQAIEVYGALLRQFNEQVEPEQVQLVLEAVSNKYVALHKAAAATALSLEPFLTREQRLQLLAGVLELERVYYADHKFDYCTKLVSIGLRLAQASPSPDLYVKLAKRYLVKYCTCGDFYTEKEFLKRLTRMAQEEPQLRPAWVAQALRYLQRVKPTFSSYDDQREELLAALHEIPYAELLAHLPALDEFVRTQIRTGHYQDVYAVYACFGAQGLHAPLHALTQYFLEHVPPTKANAHALEVNALFHRLSGLEAAVAAALVDESLLAKLRTS